MKKTKTLGILGLILISLVGCTSFFDQTACENQEASLEEWQGLQFELNACWSQTEREGELILVSESKENVVTLTQQGPDTVGIRSELKNVKNASGESYFIVLGDSYDSETLEIANSVTATAVEECGASDSTQPESYVETWDSFEFSRPWCWTSEKKPISSEDQMLHLELSGSEGETEVNFFIDYNLTGFKRTGDLSFGDNLYQVYTSASGESMLQFDASPKLHVEAANLDHADVQLILSSIIPL